MWLCGKLRQLDYSNQSMADLPAGGPEALRTPQTPKKRTPASWLEISSSCILVANFDEPEEPI
jgi:hypothetical protein